MVYKHSQILSLLIHGMHMLPFFGTKIRKVSSVHPTTSGATVIICDDETNQLYRVDVEPIKTPKVIVDSFEDVIRGGYA